MRQFPKITIRYLEIAGREMHIEILALPNTRVAQTKKKLLLLRNKLYNFVS